MKLNEMKSIYKIFKLIKVENMESLFSGCSSLSTLPYIYLRNTHKVSDIKSNSELVDWMHVY